MKDPGNTDRGRPALRRRDFLALGSLAALAPWTDRAAAAATLGIAPTAPAINPLDPMSAAAGAPGAAHPRTPPRLPLSTGYLEGSYELHNLRKLPADLRVLTITRRGNTFSAGRHMLPAHEMPAGDPSLVGGAVRMTIHDLYPGLLPAEPAAAAKWPLAIDLDVWFPLLDAPRGGGARYLAWSYRRLPAKDRGAPAEDRSARVSFLLWPDWYSDLMVDLRVVPADGHGVPRLHRAVFSLGADKDRPKLLKGVYLLGLTPGAWNDDVDLPDDPSLVPPELLSVLMTVEPEGVSRGRSR